MPKKLCWSWNWRLIRPDGLKPDLGEPLTNMNSVIITDYGVMLGKTGDRLVVRGPRPRMELIEGGEALAPGLCRALYLG